MKRIAITYISNKPMISASTNQLYGTLLKTKERLEKSVEIVVGRNDTNKIFSEEHETELVDYLDTAAHYDTSSL